MSRTRHTVFLSAARIVGIAVQIVSVPIVLDAIGLAKYGACLFLIALTRWVGLIDLGFLDGSQRRMTLAFDAGDEAKGFSVWNTYRATLLAYAAIGLGVMALLALFVHIPDEGAGVEWHWLFAIAGAVFAAQYLFQGVSVYFNSRRQFPRLAVANGAQSLLSGLLALGLTVHYRTPQAYLAGFAIGNFVVACYNLGTIARQARGSKGLFFDREVFGYTLKFGLKLYPTRIATVMTQTFDRIIITNVLGTQALTPYGVASRMPEAAQEALPINYPLMPDLTRAHAEGEASFAKSVDKDTRIALMVGCGLILVPCAFADPVLRLWLHDKFSPDMPWIMLAIGLYRALEMFYSSLALAMIAHGSPQRVLPFTLYNAAMLLLFVGPVAKFEGIVGVAALRVAIHVLQFAPLVVFTRRWIAPEIPLGRWLGGLLGTVGLAAAVAAGCVALWGTPLLTRHAWAALLIAPVAMSVFFFTVDRLGFAEVPSGVKRRVRAALSLLRFVVGPKVWRRMKVALGREVDARMDREVATERFGSAYGGWNVAAAGLDGSSVVYSFGVGGDVTFDTALIERFGVTVHAFDPTPQCIEWAREQRLPEKFVMHGYGLAGFDGEVRFFPPDDPTHVSHTILEHPSTADRSFLVPVKRLSTVMRELGHSRIDLLKMDIEGAEYGVIDDLASSDVRPSQVLIEFHHRFAGVGLEKTRRALGQMRAIGYDLVHVTETGEEYTFLLR